MFRKVFVLQCAAVTLVGHRSSEFIGKFFRVYIVEIEETEE